MIWWLLLYVLLGFLALGILAHIDQNNGWNTRYRRWWIVWPLALFAVVLRMTILSAMRLNKTVSELCGRANEFDE